MALSISNIKRWCNMLTGKSVWHVNQNIGTCFSKDKIRGYYNNMTAKVIMMPQLLNNDALPTLAIGKEKNVESAVAIFQYGLGAYDLYLNTHDEKYHQKFLQSVDWAFKKQENSGAWDNFSYFYPDHPYGAMAQGEGASLLIRAYIETGNKQFLQRAKSAIDYMLINVEKGGTTQYMGDSIIFLEYPHRKAVLNGWIFAWWGLFDFVIVTKDNGMYKKVLDNSCQSLVKMLPSFSNSYWSIYDLEYRIASPFYHNLHIAQMEAMYILTGNDIFAKYVNRWTTQQHNIICKSRAFIKKAMQKLAE